MSNLYFRKLQIKHKEYRVIMFELGKIHKPIAMLDENDIKALLKEWENG